MALAEGKKRYYLTLTESNMTEFKEMLSTFGAAPGVESVLVDEFITGMVKVIGPTLKNIMAAGRKPSMSDFFILVANQMKAIEDEQLKL